jgi:quercetin dioxygenase-like cupin family protein
MKLSHVDKLNETVARAGVSRKVFSGEGATLAWTTLEPGHTPRPHSHHYEQIVYVVTGRLRFVIGDEEAELGPGEVVVIPPGVEHFAETIGDEPAVDLSVFTPFRSEYAAEEEGGPQGTRGARAVVRGA